MIRLLRCLSRKYCTQGILSPKDPVIKEYIKNIQKRFIEDNQSSFTGRNRQLRNIFSEREKLVENLEQLDQLYKEGVEAKDKEMCQAAQEEKNTCLEAIERTDCSILDVVMSPDEDYMASGCVMEISAGVGGKEAMLFASELARMYIMFCKRKGWKIDILSENNEGLLHAVLSIEGPGVKEILSLEGGVHRVQRIPATENSGRLHTSTVAVAILPQPTDVEIIIPDNELRIETKRASGAGGQHVNTTDSAVRIVHIPTGIAVECQTERDQHKNKRNAITRLRALLYQKKLQQLEQEESSQRKAQVGQANRNEKIRTYNFQQDRVTDHRLGSSSGSVFDIDNVMDGGQLLEDLMKKIRFSIHRNKIAEEIESIRRQNVQMTQ